METLIIQVPDELVSGLERIAASRRMSIQQLAVDRLRLLVTGSGEPLAGSAQALLRVMGEPPHLTSADVDELDMAISAGRLPVRAADLF